MSTSIKIGISECLLGRKVRHDGSHKHDRYLTDTLGRYVSYVPVCPEVECGLGVPRETMRLVGDPRAPRLITHKTRSDLTEKMQQWCNMRLAQLAGEGLCGFIFKKDSPSSGMERVKVYDDNGVPRKAGTGIFAGAFKQRFPLIPVEEEGRLHDPRLRENFIERIFTLKRWRDMLAQGRRLGALVDFHTRHKLLILSHSTQIYREMGKRVADGKAQDPEALFDQYEHLLMNALRLQTTVKKNANVLMHMMGHFKKQLSPDEKQELLDLIEHYRREWVPLVVPVTLLNHYVRKYQNSYLAGQYYLNPHPVELKLRNHV